jgi:hypothetical protein
MPVAPAKPETPIEISLGPDNTEAKIFGDVKAQFNAVGKVTLFTDRPVKARLADDADPDGPIDDTIHFGDDQKSVVINGSSVEEQKDGSLLVKVRENGSTISVKPPPPPPPRIKTGLEAGDVMPDGTIFVAKLANGKTLVAAPEDISVGLDFNDAVKRAKKLKVKRKKGFHVPTREELDLLYQHREDGAFAGTYKETGKYPQGWYWTSEAYGAYGAHAQRFSNGEKGSLHRKSNKRENYYYASMNPIERIKEIFRKDKMQGSLASVRCVKVI